MLKVLQVSKFFPPVMGGIEAVAWELAEGLSHAGVASTVLCSNQSWSTRHECKESGYQVVRTGRLGALLSTSIAPAMPWHLRRLAVDADIVHIHMPDPMAAAAFCLSGSRAGLVVHWHSDVIRQRHALRFYEPLQRWLLSRADAIIATSPPYAESSRPLQPWLRKVRVVPIGISDHHAASSDHRVAGIRHRFGGRKLVFALGRMAYYKGFEVLIEAAAQLPSDSVVVIGGDGELLNDYRALVNRLGLAGRVYLPGHIDDDELPSWFAACDVFCMPSTVRAEAYGVAMLEAMATGRPVVASDIPGSGVPWVNQHDVTGFNVPVGRPELLGRRLAELLEDGMLRLTMGEAARSRYILAFHADLMIQRTLDLYKEVVHRRSA
ncbi:MAG: glycosyltransferase [Rubrivivax sp.]|nr:glycosyltransferase [Rubrivivax sp.]